MKKKVDFFRIAAIAMVGLALGFTLLESGSMLIKAVVLCLTDAYDYDAYFALSNSIAVMAHLIPTLLLGAGLLTKKNRLLLALGAGMLAGRYLPILSDNLYIFSDYFFENLFSLFENGLGMFALIVLCRSSLVIGSLCILVFAVLLFFAALSKKPLPAFLRSALPFLPAVYLLSQFIFLYCVFYDSAEYYDFWSFTKLITLDECFYPFFYLFSQMLTFFVLTFAAGSLAKEEDTSHKIGTIVVGAVGGLFFLLANLLSFCIASLSMLLNSENKVVYFDGNPIFGLFWLFCFLLVAVGILLIPVATLTFRKKENEASADAPQKAAPSTLAANNLSDSLRELKQLQDDGLISEEDYQAKKKLILDL